MLVRAAVPCLLWPRNHLCTHAQARILVGAGADAMREDRWGYSPLELAHKVRLGAAGRSLQACTHGAHVRERARARTHAHVMPHAACWRRRLARLALGRWWSIWRVRCLQRRLRRLRTRGRASAQRPAWQQQGGPRWAGRSMLRG